MKPSYLYYKDIILPYIVDNQWFNPDNFNPKKFHSGTYDFTVTVSFSTGTSYVSDTIRAITEIPTVVTSPICSVLPVFSKNSEFFFGWLCPYTQTNLIRSDYKDKMNTSLSPFVTSSNTGHYNYTATGMINSGLVPYNETYSYIKSLWIYGNGSTDEPKKVAEFDDHSRYFLIWITRDNDYMCRPFCKRYDLKESVETSYRVDVNNHSIPYQKSSEFEWTLNSDWLTYNEHNVYESLMISQYVYLYDNETEKLFPVNITDSKWSHKNEQNNKKPFNLTVTAKLNQKSNLIY